MKISKPQNLIVLTASLMLLNVSLINTNQVSTNSTENQAKQFFLKYSNNNNMMSSLQLNTFIDNFISLLKKDLGHSTMIDNQRCLHEKLNSYKQDSDATVYLNQTSFSYVTSLILAEIDECFSKNETNTISSVNKITKIIVNTKSISKFYF